MALGSTMAQAQELTGVYDFGLRETAVVTTVKTGQVTGVLGSRLSLDVDGFAGFTTRSKTPVAGIMIGKRFPIAQEVTGYVGAGCSMAQGMPVSPVVGAGIGWKF